MARIRSIHPAFFTDEAVMAASPFARLLVTGLWTESDDQGVFEWKPLTLKARLLPADAVNLDDLLNELVALGMIATFDAAGRKYGAVRNFRKFQRPKKPNAVHPLPAQYRTYVALDAAGAEEVGIKSPAVPDVEEHPASEVNRVPNQFPTGGEKSPQMEDGGWRVEDGFDTSPSLRSDDSSAQKTDGPDQRSAKKPPKAVQHDEQDVSDCVEAFNAIATNVHWPAAQILNDARRSAIRARIHDIGGKEGLIEAFQRAGRSSFLTGKTDKPFRASLDWLLKPTNFIKLTEGNYDDRSRPGDNRHGLGGERRSPHDIMLAALAEEAGLVDPRAAPSSSGRDSARPYDRGAFLDLEANRDDQPSHRNEPDR